MSFFWEKYVANDLQTMCLQRVINNFTLRRQNLITFQLNLCNNGPRNFNFFRMNKRLWYSMYYVIYQNDCKYYLTYVLATIVINSAIYLFSIVAYLEQFKSFKNMIFSKNTISCQMATWKSGFISYFSLHIHNTQLNLQTTLSCFRWINYPTFL